MKTVRFGRFTYIGDPCNTVRIFNELEVDELFFVDITATRQRRAPNLKMLSDIAQECFMPLGYGGGIRSVDQAKALFDIGIEKICINSAAAENPGLITDIARQYGSQAVIVSIDVKANIWGRQTVWAAGGTVNTGLSPVEWAMEAERRGAGEILLTSIDREGTWSGFDLPLVKSVASAVSVPVVAQGGAGTVEHIGAVVKQAGASAVALGSMVVFQKKGMGVLVNFPNSEHLETVLA